MNYSSSKKAKIVLSKSIFDVKNQLISFLLQGCWTSTHDFLHALKVSYFRKDSLPFSNLSKKQNNWIIIPLGKKQNYFALFLEESLDWKKYCDFVWPLVSQIVAKFVNTSSACMHRMVIYVKRTVIKASSACFINSVAKCLLSKQKASSYQRKVL